MKIAILYVCTGKYEIFWKDFYLSSEKYFVNDIEKHYFVFTDAKEIFDQKNNTRIHKIDQKIMGWPYDTLKRYEMFSKHKKELEGFDYIVFLNANLLFLEKVTGEEFLPQGDEKILACLHPVFYKKDRHIYTYEKNKDSEAYIDISDDNKDYYYYQGAINGGRAKEFIEVIAKLQSKIDKDLEKNIISVWWDESHWNKYLDDHRENLKTISPSYLYPENFNLPLEPKIMIRNKDQFGHLESIRNIKVKLSRTLIKNIYSRIKNKIKYSLFKIYDSIVFTQKGIFRLKNKNINSDRKISVVITYFNRHDTIHKALYNILADNRVDEILIVDDHSENASFSYLQDLVKKINNPKVKVIRNDVNLGVYKNKIYSVNKAKNDWLILLDSDNTITLDYLNTVFSIEKWDDDTIYGPVFGWPLIDNTKIAGKTYTISDIKNLLIHQSKEIKQFLNLGNFLINKNNFYNITIEYIDYNPYASDVIFVNYIWLSKGKKINILNCKYIHRVNPDSTWKIQNVQSAVKFENIKNAILTLETDPKKII